ncbi:MAG: response regulator [Proteobacteria bacterium]|nr:response regulator [Pseudomonadota bacterium]MBU1710588.1 response regulator [Pseudomonadota bacterium]
MPVKILIVDDEKEILAWMKISLENIGFHVRCSIDAKDALKAYDEEKADLIITDMVMPGMSGLTLIMELNKIDPEVKIIAISGGGIINGQRYLALAKEIGADLMLPKPFGEKELHLAIKEVLG